MLWHSRYSFKTDVELTWQPSFCLWHRHCFPHISHSLTHPLTRWSLQVEGAWQEDGRTPSVWDTYSHVPGNIKNNDNGDVACDHYHKYPEDFRMMKAMGIKHYR